MTKNEAKRAERAYETVVELARKRSEVWPWMVERHHSRADSSRGLSLAVTRGVVRRSYRTGRGGSKIYDSLLKAEDT